MKIAITGGGTGGHLSIALALLEAAHNEGHEVIYIGSTGGQDQSWFQDEKRFSARYFLSTSGVVNRKYLGKLWALYKIFKAVMRSRKILKTEKIDAVISVGGYSAAPATYAAFSRSIPFFIQEQNAVMGRLNAMMKPYARAFYSAFDANSPVKNYPIREAFFKKARVRHEINAIIFLGGSQGAQFINNLALKVAKTLQDQGIKIIHQCGQRDYERVSAAYIQKGVEVELYDFTDKLPELMEASDLAVSRAGASTLFELAANGLVALYVPYPYAAGDHQFYNGKYLVDQELSWCYRECDDYEKYLLDILPKELSEMSAGLMAMSHKDGAVAIIKDIQERIDVS